MERYREIYVGQKYIIKATEMVATHTPNLSSTLSWDNTFTYGPLQEYNHPKMANTSSNDPIAPFDLDLAWVSIPIAGKNASYTLPL